MTTLTEISTENVLSMSRNYKIMGYDADKNNEAKPYVILHHLEDIATWHANELKIGYDNIHPLGLAWFVLKYHLRFEKLPKAWDKVRVLTWPLRLKGVQCRREFEIFDEKEEKIGVASSSWVLVNLETKRIAKPQNVFKFNNEAENYALETDFSKIPLPQRADFVKEFQVRFNDLDLNGHTNNANYITWATETMPYDFLEENSFYEIEISYKKEATCGMILKSVCEFDKEKNVSTHVLKNKDNDEELTNVRIVWKKRQAE